MNRAGLLGSLMLLLGLLGAFGLARPAYAATITVTTTVDEFGTGPDCALREAIQAANTDVAFGGCLAGSGDDTIALQALTYTLSRPGANDDLNQSGDLDIRSNIIITGAGSASTIIDGNGSDRVLDVLGTHVVGVSGVTIRNGHTSLGGGIYNRGTMTVTNSSISNNIADQNGGGIYNQAATLTIISSTVGNNRARFGSGIYSDHGTLSIVNNSTFTNNNADEIGGGVYNVNGEVA